MFNPLFSTPEACVGPQEGSQWLVEARRTSVRMAQYVSNGVVNSNAPAPIIATMPYGSASEVASEINEEGNQAKFKYKKTKENMERNLSQRVV